MFPWLIKKKPKQNICITINEFCKFFKQQDPSCEQIIFLMLFFVHSIIWCLVFCMGVMSVGHWQRIETTHVFFSVTPKVRSNHKVLWCPSIFLHTIMFRFCFPFPSFLLRFIFVKSDLFIHFLQVWKNQIRRLIQCFLKTYYLCNSFIVCFKHLLNGDYMTKF